jgi:hypothetical protein
MAEKPCPACAEKDALIARLRAELAARDLNLNWPPDWRLRPNEGRALTVLLRPGHHTADELMDAIYCDRPRPACARQILSNAVRVLRLTLFGEQTYTRRSYIESRGGGYELLPKGRSMLLERLSVHLGLAVRLRS